MRSTRNKGRGRMDTHPETSFTTVSWNQRNILINYRNPKDAPKVWRGNNFSNFEQQTK